MKLPRGCHQLPDALWQVACDREAIIRPLAQADVVSREAAAAAAGELGVHPSLVYRLVARYRLCPQTSSLAPGPRGRPRTGKYLDARVERLVAENIQRVYLRRERARISDLHQAVKVDCRRLGLKVPAYNTLRARVHQLDAAERTRRREGAAAARQRFGPVGPSSLQPAFPLEIVQVDHTLVDCLVVDERERRPLKRPWLTLAIDVASRLVTGFHLSLLKPSSLSVALALTQAVLPKELWLADRELDLDWPAAGLPAALHLDNAREFKSRALERATREHGISLLYRPPGQPHFGGHVERLIGTVMGAVHLLPGTTEANVVRKGAYRPAQKATLTLFELERWLALQIAGVYHQRVHSALGQSPLEAWREGLARRGRPAVVPPDRQRFFIDLLPGERRLIRRDGVRLFHLHYWHSVLSPLAGRSQARALFRYDPRDLSRIYWQDQEGRYWPIPYAQLAHPPVSKSECDHAAAVLRAQQQTAPTDKQLIATVLAQRQLLSKAQTKTARQRRECAPAASERPGRSSGPASWPPAAQQAVEPGSDADLSPEVDPFPVDFET